MTPDIVAALLVRAAANRAALTKRTQSKKVIEKTTAQLEQTR